MKHVIGWICLVALLFSAVASAQTKKVTYYYPDPQGNVLAEADGQGNVTKTYDYKPYGSGAMGALDDGPSYTGHVNDSDTGLLYMQARYQDPVTGRFLSVDPESISSGNVSSFNRYSYAVNNPYTHTDPSGRCVEDLCIGESIVLCAATPCGAAVAAAFAEVGAITIAAFAINDEPVVVQQDSRSAPPPPLPEAGGAPHSIPDAHGGYTTYPTGKATSGKQYRPTGKSHGDVPRPNVKEWTPNVDNDGVEHRGKGKVRAPESGEDRIIPKKDPSQPPSNPLPKEPVT